MLKSSRGSSAMGKLKQTSPPHANAGCQRARRPRNEARRSFYTPTRTVSAAFQTMPLQPTRPVDQHFEPTPTCAYAGIPPATHRQSRFEVLERCPIRTLLVHRAPGWAFRPRPGGWLRNLQRISPCQAQASSFALRICGAAVPVENSAPA